MSGGGEPWPDEGGEAACWAHLLDPVGDDALGDAVLAAVVRASGDAVIIADPQGRIAYWNAAAERLFGWSSAQAVGRGLELVIPEGERARHDEGYRRAVTTGVTRHGHDVLRVTARHATGALRSVALTVTVLRETGPEGDGVGGIAAIIRDETDRRPEPVR